MPVLSRPRSAEVVGLKPSWTARAPLYSLVASLAAAAGIHLSVGYGHDFEGRHGAFFVIAGVVQAIGAVVVAVRMLTRPVVAPGRLVGIVALGIVGLVAVGTGGLADDGHDHHHAPEPESPVDHPHDDDTSHDH